jgi:hypothetical protein
MVRSSRPVCVIAGHSHTWALGFPIVHPDGVYGVVPHPDDERFVGLKGPCPPDAQYWTELVKLSKAHPIALSFRGNQHLADFMFASTPAFDFAVASRPDLPVDDTAVLVPELMLREFFAPSLTELAQVLAEMRATGGPGVIVLEAPPARDHLEEQRWQLFTYPYFVQTATALGSDLSTIALAPALLLSKVRQVIQDMVRTIAEAHGATFLPFPAETLTPTGFLRDDLCEPDMGHATRAYGAMVLRDLAALIANQPPQA